MDDLIRNFRKNGLAFVPGAVSRESIDNLYMTIFILFKKAFPSFFSWGNNSIDAKIWNDQRFHDSIIDARKKDPIKFGAIYDSLQLTLAAKKILTDVNIIRLISKLFDTELSNVSCRSSIIRLDCPFDTKNSIDWHFDAISTKNMKHLPEDGISVNISFHETHPMHGSAHFLPGSHTGKHVQKVLNSNKNNESDRYIVNEKVLKQFKSFQFSVLDIGDLVFFPMTMIHKSGENSSSKVRISGVFRFYKINSESFIFQKEDILDNDIEI